MHYCFNFYYIPFNCFCYFFLHTNYFGCIVVSDDVFRCKVNFFLQKSCVIKNKNIHLKAIYDRNN